MKKAKGLKQVSMAVCVPFLNIASWGLRRGKQGQLYRPCDPRYSRASYAEPQWHIHHLDFQMIYILKGWVIFEYEGQGEVTFRAGSAALQPPGIKHREVSHSDDLELIEITSPAEFETELTDPPA